MLLPHFEKLRVEGRLHPGSFIKHTPKAPRLTRWHYRAISRGLRWSVINTGKLLTAKSKKTGRKPPQSLLYICITPVKNLPKRTQDMETLGYPRYR
jgi:hypothetical protein